MNEKRLNKILGSRKEVKEIIERSIKFVNKVEEVLEEWKINYY